MAGTAAQGFVRDALGATLSGSVGYRLWLGCLLALALCGMAAYAMQWQQGLIVTGMSDQVSWGFYIANFTFLVGIAAAAVLLVIPAYVFHRRDAHEVVLIGEAMAVAAVISAMLFVIVDIGRPDRLLHMLPGIGRLHFPESLLAWDVLVLSGYLMLNLIIPGYLLYCRYSQRPPRRWLYLPLVMLAMFWAIAIHTVTAFLLSSNVGRPFWHVALLAPRFIATAFASGPALIILVLLLLDRLGWQSVSRSLIELLALIMTVALQISLFFVGAELFTDLYHPTAHGASLHYLYFGLEGRAALAPWVWSALLLNVLALPILMLHPLRKRLWLLVIACLLVFVGVWIEKGMGLVVPGFIPTPLGEVFEYRPTAIELVIAAGIWALGALVFSLLARAALAIAQGRVRAPSAGKLRLREEGLAEASSNA